VSRVLVVGWDGGTWSVAGPLADEGRLPALAALRSGGAEGALESVPNMNSAPAWSTAVTGVNPGRHGIFYFDEPVPGSYQRAVVNASRRSAPTLWRMASDAGKRIVVVNVPISYPAEAVNGYVVAGLDTPSKALPGFTHPADLPSRLQTLFDGYVIEPGAPSLVRAGRIEEARDRLVQCVEGWVSVTESLMQEPWDLVFVVFTSTDTAQHFFWQGEGRRTVERVYEVQDEASARLVDAARDADPDVNVIVMADHGGAANTRGPEFLPIWLRDQGLLASTRPPLRSRALSVGFNVLNRTLTREQKLALARRMPRMRQRAQAEARTLGIDWARTRAYSDGHRDDVLLNVAGREPQGTIPATSYGSFVAGLKERIGGIAELGTGRPAVDSVLARDEAYRGPFVERAPDLTIRWNLGGPFRGFACDTRWGRERMEEVAATRPLADGGHHPDGMFVANGPDIRAGSVRGRLEDLTPTVLALLGVPVPASLDGRPLDVLRSQPELSEDRPGAEAASPQAEDAYTPEQEEAVRQRLEDMGYL
jgi:predicted AlkP superfamily phosphohydrolase/phosphomutase